MTQRKRRSKSRSGRRRRSGGPVSGPPERRRPSITPVDVETLQEAACAILGREAPDVPRPSNAGRAMLVVALDLARQNGESVTLDYREYDDRWEEIADGQASSVPLDILPFHILATEQGGYEVDLDGTTGLAELYRMLQAIQTPGSARRPEPPLGVGTSMHKQLWNAARTFDRRPFARSELKASVDGQSDSSMVAGDPVSVSTVCLWLSRMVRAGHLNREGHGKGTRYRWPPRST